MWNNTQQEESTEPQCSFCHKSQNQVQQLIAGPGNTYICNECTDLYREHIEKMAGEPITTEKLMQTCPVCAIRAPASHHFCYNCGTKFVQGTS